MSRCRLALPLLVILCAPLAAAAQQAGRTPLVGMLGGGSVVGGAFRQGLAELGYVEGRNLLVEERSPATPDAMAAAASELVGRRVDVIFVAGTPAARAAQRATQTIPIVFSGTADPVGAGLARSLARPGGNATGLTSISVELSAKRIEMLRDAIPGLGRVGVLAWGLSHPEGDQPTRFQLIVNLTTAKALGVTVPQRILQRADQVIR